MHAGESFWGRYDGRWLQVHAGERVSPSVPQTRTGWSAPFARPLGPGAQAELEAHVAEGLVPYARLAAGGAWSGAERLAMVRDAVLIGAALLADPPMLHPDAWAGNLVARDGEAGLMLVDFDEVAPCPGPPCPAARCGPDLSGEDTVAHAGHRNGTCCDSRLLLRMLSKSDDLGSDCESWAG